MTLESSNRCIACQSLAVERFVEVPRVPVLCNILWPSRAEAMAVQRVDLALAFCHTCGHIYNPDFDLALMDYSQVYENSLHFSPRFQHYADSLAEDLVKRHHLSGKQLIEIGCGKGDFLEMLCELGDNRGVGFDPSYVAGETARTKTGQITFVQDFYSEQYADIAADFICCRHTLEHIPEPRAFLEMLRRTVGDRTDTQIFFEVPNALHTLQGLAIWDLIYEHCSYFTKYSLASLFTDTGFQVTDVRETFAGQFLTVEAMPAPKFRLGDRAEWNRPEEIVPNVRQFAVQYRRKVEKEQTWLSRLQQSGRKAAIWGAGSKGITFLNVLDPGDQIPCAVDINPRKQGMYITGTGQEIVEPERLREVRPEYVLIMNSIYTDEIRETIESLGVDAELLTV